MDIPEDRAEEHFRKFGPLSSDLQRLADWLIEHHFETVVMESTRVYWIPVFQVMESRGLEVELVNAQPTIQRIRLPTHPFRPCHGFSFLGESLSTDLGIPERAIEQHLVKV